jgi:pilus assembly protein CpaE
MPPGALQRIVLVGVDRSLQPSLQSALRGRSTDPFAVCADLDAARSEVLSHPGDSHLFIVQVSTNGDLSRLSMLTSAAPGQPVVALLPPGADLAQVVAAQRAGAAQVVPLPLQADDFQRALDCVAVQFAAPARDAPLIAVCGVTGGCGATTIALNLALELAGGAGVPGRSGCLLVELARQTGSLATYLDVEPPLSTHELLTDASRLTAHGVRQALTAVAPGLDVLVGPYRDINPGAVPARHVYQLLQLCRRLGALVLLDVPAAYDELLFETLALADHVLLVGVQSVSSVRTLKMVRDTLEREEGIQDMRLVINRYEPGIQGFSAERLAELLQAPRVYTVANDYPAVMAAVNHGKPLRDVAPNSPVLADIRALARTLAAPAAPSTPADSADRLARALGRGTAPLGPRAVRVLHVEDDPIQQDLVAMHLAAMRDFRFLITTAASESEAIRQFRQRPFDVVLLDYHLAQGNGLECLRQIRATDPLVPIVVLSGLAQAHVAGELLSAGADEFLSKENLSSETLSRALTEAVARADACKQRQAAGTPSESARLDAFFDRIRKAAGVSDEAELVRSLQELHETAPTGRFSAGQIQRLTDLVCAELDRGRSATALPRKALLALFLRLFGGT